MVEVFLNDFAIMDAIGMYITQSSVNKRTVDDVWSAKSLMKIRKSRGPNTEPWGTPDFTAAESDISPSTTISIYTDYTYFTINTILKNLML